MRRIELQQTVATLQEALNAAHRRIREQEQVAGEMNLRFAEVQAQRDDLEIRLRNREEAAQAQLTTA